MSQDEKCSGAEKAWQILQSGKTVSHDEESAKTERNRQAWSPRWAEIREQEVRVCESSAMNSMGNVWSQGSDGLLSLQL